MRRTLHPAGLVLIELAAAVVVLALLSALLFVAAKEGRRQSSLGDNLANLKQFASATGAFAADNDDRVWGFTGSPHDASIQAMDILRRRCGREHWFPPYISNWAPQILYSHLVLLDYLDVNLPSRFVAAPEDRLLLLWQRDPFEGFQMLPPTQRPGEPGIIPENSRWAFSSSYELPPAFYSLDARRLNPFRETVSQPFSALHSQFNIPYDAFRTRRLAEVAHPGAKVTLYERYQRHFGPRELFFAYEEARIPLLLVDGSAAVRRTGEANRGFYPNWPTNSTVSRVYYEPAPWEPRTASGAPQQLVTLHYRFTRSGLRGRDFGGPEVPWQD